MIYCIAGYIDGTLIGERSKPFSVVQKLTFHMSEVNHQATVAKFGWSAKEQENGA